MSQKFPIDEFDSAAIEGGRHRARRTSRDRIREFLRVAVAASIFGLVAIGGLKIVDGTVAFNPADLVAPSPSTAATSVKLTGVTVIDGTGQLGLASKTAHKLLDAGWNVLTADNATSTEVVTRTQVLLSSPQFEAAAKVLLRTLGDYEVLVSGGYADPITVVLGSDFK